MWLIENERRLAIRTLKLVEAVMDDPFTGIGKPEHLKHWAPNVWSRRINDEHRLVYLVEGDRISFLQCHYHYT